jgi:hypothetical protein
MTTLPDLKSKIAAYLQKAVVDFTVNGIDLLLDAINRSHQYAQMQYDFELMRCSVDVSISLTQGAFFSPALIHGTSNYVTVKKVRRAYFNDGTGVLRPINFINREGVSSDLDLRWRGEEFSRARAYPQPFSGYDTPSIVQTGITLYMYPTDTNVVGNSPVEVVLDVYRYFPDYSTDLDNDFLLQFGDDFLMWASVCRLNYFSKEFVNRQEGNVSPPEKERDAAWADLLAWDGSLLLSGDTALTLD